MKRPNLILTLLVPLCFLFMQACSANMATTSYEIPVPPIENPAPLGQSGTLIMPTYVDDAYTDWVVVGSYEAQSSLGNDAWSYFRQNTGGYLGKHYIGLYEKPDNIMHLVSIYIYDQDRMVHVAHNTEKGFWMQIPEAGKALVVGLLDGNTYMLRRAIDGMWQARLVTE